MSTATKEMTDRELMKHCNGCLQDLPLSHFNNNSRAADGLEWRFRICKGKESLRSRTKPESQAARRAYYEANKKRLYQRRMERLRERKANGCLISDPVKDRARQLVRYAIRRGHITKPAENGHGRLEFHHPDHSRPYFGCWLTRQQHEQVDHGTLECPAFVDYEPQVIQGLIKDLQLSRLGLTAALSATKTGTEL